MINWAEVRWRRAERCTGGNCIEVAKVDGRYWIRDSKTPDVAALSFSEEEWLAFIGGVNQGEFSF
ncbi:MAG TPA: DUF397 domain-containing protein [Actinoplanes sp.]|nr:DUF397 domain-containing protein [Actinoplanes sp.]